MSLGRLLRRASSRASDLLTLTPGGGGGACSILDGEIIYSKNNVCVHPPEGLQGLGEHHPGYLCLYMEKDELLGATVILAWVPNARIQRQDEEALRYVTPESSPVREVPRPRGRRAQSLGAPRLPSPTEPKPTLTPGDSDVLVVAQSVQGAVRVGPSPEEGEKLALALGPGLDSTLTASPSTHSCSRALSVAGPSGGAEEGRELQPEAGEEEGSLALSADGVSRDSSFDSDSDAFSSPFCLSPISAALAGSSGSVFLESDSSSQHSHDLEILDQVRLRGLPGERLLRGPGSSGTSSPPTPGSRDRLWLSVSRTLRSVRNGGFGCDGGRPRRDQWAACRVFLSWEVPVPSEKPVAGGQRLPTIGAQAAQRGHVPAALSRNIGRARVDPDGNRRVHELAHRSLQLGWRACCSPSGSDANLRFPDSSSPMPAPRWDEPQRACALEQICGVFRVDLGHMRSLRLFFSDEACTSGQLVVASRESQYKVFHFHHGGLDKLVDVFQQWKYCAGTPLKDQVAPERTCMQFSIRRPKLPSSETHPEERLYRRLDASAWLGHLNELGQAIFFGGIDVSIRGEVWPFLLRYYSHESTSEQREALRVQKRKEYAAIQQRRLSMTPEEHQAFWRNVQFTVDKDVVRTDRNNQFFRGEGNPNVESMSSDLQTFTSAEGPAGPAPELRLLGQAPANESRSRRILLNYAVYNPAIGYSQGMSDLVAPILAEVLDESDTFWCFVGLMQNTIFVSSPRDEDMERQLLYLRELLRLTHLRFYQHLVALGEDGLQMLFCHRWLLLCFKREFPEAEALRIWEACWAHYQTDYFHLFICVAIVAIYGDDVIEQQLATDQMLLHFGNLAMHMSGELVLRKARSLLYQFRLLPRIPCSLHDLCKLCGSGVWDSGYLPAVECTGHHPGSESCPYGGTVDMPSPKPQSGGKKGPKSPREGFGFRR
ncbi:TBC1 domain family member 16 [Tupaia chinensis]|uniref:TBC1 domain family member 16 n=1 Tax=Tupaia chinensis TaxID=246437 RepID=L9L497_TUPCH|nr:TBC1 domain family member 16 [Tupaia chinensis]